MRESLPTGVRRAVGAWRGVVAVAAALSASAPAWALPWSIDMTDSDSIKAYERAMRPLPEGVVSQPNLLTPIGYTRNFVRESPEGQALTNPYDAADKAFLAAGERMYSVYCSPCHGAYGGVKQDGSGQELGPVAAPGRYPGVAVLAGPNGRLKLRTDGHVYLTIRNGGGIMPSYGWAMNDKEMWSVVAFMRSRFPDAAAPSVGAAPGAPVTPAAPPTPAAPAPTTPAKEGAK